MSLTSWQTEKKGEVIKLLPFICTLPFYYEIIHLVVVAVVDVFKVPPFIPVHLM